MFRMQFVRLIGSFFALSLLCGGAKAVPVSIADPATPLLPGVYQLGLLDGFKAPGASFTDVYDFNYLPPPFVTTLSVTTNNNNFDPQSLIQVFGIPNLNLSWVHVPTNTTIFSGGVATVLTTSLATPFTGLYHLILEGDAIAAGPGITGGGWYTSTLTVAVNPGITETPLPGAVVLFGSVLAGGVAFMRRRRNEAKAA